MIVSPVEWLETNGLGGYASQTSTGISDRRYHALLAAAASPPLGRLVLVNTLDAFIGTSQGFFALSSHKYAPGITHPDGVWRIESFKSFPWPTWRYRLDGGIVVQHEIFMTKGEQSVFLSWRVVEGASKDITLTVRPLISGREAHALHVFNRALWEESVVEDACVFCRPYKELPGISMLSNGEYKPVPEWYYAFVYDEERARGYDFQEDLNSPGVFRWHPGNNLAVLVLSAAESSRKPSLGARAVLEQFEKRREEELRRRNAFSSRLHFAADSYIVRGGKRATVIAGYPWFSDWGRDTFISLRGLCLATGRTDDAEAILLSWAEALSRGMIPNCFSEKDGTPQYNSVDSALWFILAADEFLKESSCSGHKLRERTELRILEAIDGILSSYSEGSRYGIVCDNDGLLFAGEPGTCLTWMDAGAESGAVTARIGKPIEVQALWLNALDISNRRLKKRKGMYDRGLKSLRSRFWNEEEGCLFDVVDLNRERGAVDASFRPNQIFAVGGLSVSFFGEKRSRLVLSAVEEKLLTPFGLRTLAPGSPGYAPKYLGNQEERDRAYHRGTVWPWLMGPFVEAWLKVRKSTDKAKAEAREKFLKPLLSHLECAGAGHVSEIFDGDAPHAPRGCPFQAWSLAELIRLETQVLGKEKTVK